MNKIFPSCNITGRLLLLFILSFLGVFHELQAQPDLVVVESALINSLVANTLNNNDDCYVSEGCVGGTGLRQVLRFTTHIRNIGNQDFYVGAPPSSPADENEVWEWDQCHGHWHYEGYAEYVLFDQAGNQIPIGFKNGFCLIDVECAGGGTFTYTCNNQGISAGCGDIYGSGLACQWIDVTDVDDGIYKLVLRVNWDEDPDALGNYESNYTNNSGAVCFDLTKDASGTASITVLGNGTNCSGNTCHDVTLTINLDNYTEETSWEIRNENNLVVVSSNGTYAGEADGATVSQTICLPEGCYDFIIADSYGDGICCNYGNGSYQLTDPSGNVLASGGSFGSSETTNFCVGPPPPCPDADDDGICEADDCDDTNSAVPAPPGAACDDGNPNTVNDEIQADGCSCAGNAPDDCSSIHILTSPGTITIEHINTFPHVNIQIFNSGWQTIASCLDNCGEPYVLTNLPQGTYYVSVKIFGANWQTLCDILETVTVPDGGGCIDNDNDGTCQPNDCNDNDASIPTNPGTTCNDGNPNTDNDVIQNDGCTCQGTPIGCPDNDNDGICQADDCNDNDASIPTTPGTACDDGNANTDNDVIQNDGCTCQGDSNNGCDAVISTGSGTITVSNIGNPNSSVQIFNSSWATIFTCFTDCENPQIVDNLDEDTYNVKVKLWDSNWQMICELNEFVTVTSGCTPGQACDDNDPCTINETYDTNCDCNGGNPVADADGDGYCADIDCDDNNPAVPTTPGTVCDDGDTNTNNDIIQNDGCTCQGTPIGCPDNDNDGICQADDCNDNDASIPTTPGTACDDGNPNTINDVIQNDGCTCQGTPITPDGCQAAYTTGNGSLTVVGISDANVRVKLYSTGSGGWNLVFECFNNCGDPLTINDLPNGDYYLEVQSWDGGWQSVCSIGESLTVTGNSGLESEIDKEHLFFLATKNGRAVNLNWAVKNTEDHTSHFVIERSVDGINFSALKTTESLYNRNGIFNYQENDNEPFYGANYYRLKLVHYNGDFNYSEVRRVEILTHWKDFSVFPNPANQSILLNLAKFDGMSGKITIVDQLGQVMQVLPLEKIGTKPIKMEVGQLQAGLYFIYLKVDGRKAVSQKLVISRL